MLCIPISVPYTQPFYWCINLTGTKCFIHLSKAHHQVTHSYAQIQKWAITDYSTIVILIQKRAITNSSLFLIQNRAITYYYWISHTKLGNHWLPYHCISHTKHSITDSSVFLIQNRAIIDSSVFLTQNRAITDYSTTVFLIQNTAITDSSVFLIQNRATIDYYWISHTKLGNQCFFYSCISLYECITWWYLAETCQCKNNTAMKI